MSFPTRIGVQLQPQHSPNYGHLRDAVLRCEDLGVDVAFNWDHFYPLYGDPDGAPRAGRGRARGGRGLRQARSGPPASPG